MAKVEPAGNETVSLEPSSAVAQGVEQKPCVGSLTRLDTLDNLGPFALQLSGILDRGRLGSTGGGNLGGIVGLGLRCRSGGRRGGRNGLRRRRCRLGG